MTPRFKILSSLLFVFTLFLSDMAFASQQIVVYRDFGHKGDENQVNGVLRAFAKIAGDIDVKEFNMGQESDLRFYVNTLQSNVDKKPIILAVGEKTVNSFSEMLPFVDTISVHLCHMVTSDHPKLVGKVDFMALPIHAIDHFDQTIAGTKTQLIKTIGVSHNRQIETIEQIYQANKNKISKNGPYLGIILGGDAPTPEGKIQLFTEENVRHLANYVADMRQDRHLLIINGPRTGKHDAQLQEIKTSHRDGQKDFVTQAFVDELSKRKISEDQYTLFDFQFNVPNNDMDLVLGALRQTQSSVLVPGESTSSISECIDVLHPNAVSVYCNTAMNLVHGAHVKSEMDANRIKLLSLDLKEVHDDYKIDVQPVSSAAETIASALYKKVTAAE
ncbi:MAG: hypothetical protein Q8L85_06835 [Alphaproteobacteria bacterium]|nr:hypothetical protein [Alphaproteobacteria bacterium]